MIFLKSIELTNIIYYKKAILDLDYTGLTVINGANLNVVSAEQTNACGKSLLVSAISDVIKSTVPVGSNSKRGVPKELYGEGSSIDLKVELENGTKYCILKYLKGKSVKFSIFEDDEDTEIRTPSLAIEELQKIFPISNQEYFTLYHLDSRRPFDLQLGTQATRHNFFSDLFKLDDFDAIKEICDTRLLDLKDDAIRQETLISQAVLIEKEISSFDTTTEKTYKKLDKEYGIARTRHGELTTLLSDLKLIESHSDQIEFVSGYDLTETAARSELVDLKKEAESYIKYRVYKKSFKKYNEKYADTYNKLRELSSDVQEVFGTTKVDDINAELEVLRDLQEERSSLVSTIKRLKSGLKDIDKPDLSEDELSNLIVEETDNLEKEIRSISMAKAKSKEASDRISELEKHKVGSKSECATCGSDLPDDMIDSLIDESNKNVRKHNKLRKESVNERSVIENRLTLYRKDQATWQEYESSSLVKKEIKELRDKLPDKVDYKKSKELSDKYIQVYNKLHEMEKPEWKKRVPNDVSERVNDLSKFCNMIESTKAARKLLKTYGKSIDEIVDDITKYESEISEVNEVTTSCHEKISILKASVISYKRDVKQLDRINDKLDELKDSLKDAPVYKLLRNAYSSKGIKTLIMNTIANSISDNMNKYSNLLFSEPMEFSIDIAPNVFDILVARGKSKKRISDVRSLSGSESRCFNVLLAISVLPMIPKKNRLNIMILDEMTANLSEVSRDLFINNFLPVLTQIVPHVIIVTPDNDVYPDARTFVATKKGNETKLLKSSV